MAVLTGKPKLLTLYTKNDIISLKERLYGWICIQVRNSK